MKRSHQNRALACAGALLAVLPGVRSDAAYTWNEIQFSGFVSQGFVYSSDNDYLGTESSDGDFDMREYAFSASRRFGSQWRVGAQVFGQRLGRFGHDTPTLDWAIVDYNVSQTFGIRAGRIKVPRGLYNEALDLDIARVQSLLPQSIYDARLRDFNASVDGAMFYGSFGLGQAGSLDYKVYYGEKRIARDGGVRDFASDGTPTLMDRASVDSAYGASLVWSAADIPLRLSATFQRLDNLDIVSPVFGMPGMETAVFFPDGLDSVILSAEYMLDQWTFVAEAGRGSGDISLRTNFGMPVSSLGSYETDYGYVSAARRLSDRVEVGAYVSFAVDGERTGLSNDHQYDYALSFRFDPRDRVVLKAEAHYVDGTGLIADRIDAPQSVASRKSTWTYYTAKVTFFF
ncbi:hypothetical protein ASA1KI_04900 [Opitutales bacterium ASA1]|uniref:hypothetical protein n=1 Tax=Congregicoccus parvus TaxID=3081749 RepID=UPI002B2B39C5|nr:hypothetical protein ASA1KI_04900 [Opitutales bacterium ASA1]